MTGYTNLYLYKNTKFFKHQNYVIDDIVSFLATLQLDKLTFEELQYFRPDTMTKELKIQFNQKGIKSLHQYNYACVEIFNVDGTKEWELFYFVDRVEWLSMDCIKLHMTLDTLNSFLDTLEFHPRTFIEREHCDRWLYDSYIKDEENQKITLLRNIPELNEGLNPQKYGYYINEQYSFEINSDKNPMNIIDSSDRFGLVSWGIYYISYIEETIQSAIFETYCIPNIESDYSFYVFTNEAIKSNVVENILSDSSDNQKMILVPYPFTERLKNASQYNIDNPFRTTPTDSDHRVRSHTYTNTSKKLIGVALTDRAKARKYPEEYVISEFIYSKNNQNLITFDNAIKEIFCCSFQYNLISGIVDNGFFKSNNFSNESGLYNSEYLSINFAYEDFNYSLSLEDYKFNNSKTLLEILSSKNGIIKITFSVSYQIDNFVAFRFTTGIGAFSINRDNNGDLLPCTLSSQYPFTNSEYINYMRNSFNYDIKLRDINRSERQTNIGLQIAQTSALVGLGVATGGIGGALIGGKAIKGGFGVAHSIFADYYQSMREDVEMEKRQSELKGSKIGIEQLNGGIDKLLQTNRPQKLSMSIMLPRKSWWKYLEDYFYFFGNKVQYYGIPTHNNRCLFDYLKCKPEFVNRNNVPNEEALQDIIARLGNGITFIHKYLNQWTFDSDYKENVENRLLEIIQGD